MSQAGRQLVRQSNTQAAAKRFGHPPIDTKRGSELNAPWQKQRQTTHDSMFFSAFLTSSHVTGRWWCSCTRTRAREPFQVWRLVHPEPETRTPKPEPQTPKPETRNTKPEILNTKPETRNPKSETRNLETETRDPKPETRNPKPETRNPKPET